MHLRGNGVDDQRIVVSTSTEFREAVAKLSEARSGVIMYRGRPGVQVQEQKGRWRTYTLVLPPDEIELDELFEIWPPVRFDDFAEALHRKEMRGEKIPKLEVFTIKDINAHLR
jgi:hypothetical protein